VSTADAGAQAERLTIGEHLLLGRGEEKSGGRRKQALLADGYEALIAAIYLDGGVEQARAFIEREFAPLFEESGAKAARSTITSRRCRSTCSRRASRCRSTG
jgi:ribonuclease-3